MITAIVGFVVMILRSVDEPLLVATIVNVDSLDQSSRMGRIISEQVQARLTQQGYSVVELSYAESYLLKKIRANYCYRVRCKIYQQGIKLRQ